MAALLEGDIGCRLGLGQCRQMVTDADATAAHRLRKRCRELLRAEIAETVSSPADVDEELREMFQAVGG